MLKKITYYIAHRNHTAVIVVRNAVCTEFKNVLQTSRNFSRVTFVGLASSGIYTHPLWELNIEIKLKFIWQIKNSQKITGKRTWTSRVQRMVYFSVVIAYNYRPGVLDLCTSHDGLRQFHWNIYWNLPLRSIATYHWEQTNVHCGTNREQLKFINAKKLAQRTWGGTCRFFN